MKLEHLSSAVKVARFLGTPEDTVIQLLEEGRLGGVLVDALRRRGVPVTPKVKNSIETVVRTMNPDQASGGVYALGPETTVTIMFTDIVGSTAITEQLGDRGAREVLRRHDEIIRRQTQAHGGVEVKSMGDGFMLTFQSAWRGVACAVAAQQGLVSYNMEHAATPVLVRMGLSVGEPLREEQDLFGNSVILAARISAHAQGGQVLISHVVHSLLAGNGEFRFRQVGPRELKGISGDHMLYEVSWREE